MRRPSALLFAAALLAPATALAEPLDLDIRKLGIPSADVIAFAARGAGATPTPAEYQAAADARQRFALLSAELGLALSAPVLAPADTTGHSGFDFGLEAAYVPVSDAAPGGLSYWPTKGPTPSSLFLLAYHVRKALPLSLEIGARAIYLNQSGHLALQGELKWALVEGYRWVPDVAVRGAWTVLTNSPDWSLSARDLDFLVSKRFGVAGVMSLTPYGALRLAWVDARSDAIDFAPSQASPASPFATVASFPDVGWSDHLFTRALLGVRMQTYVVNVTLEGSYLFSKQFSGKAPADLGPNDLPPFEVPSSISAALKLGLAF